MKKKIMDFIIWLPMTVIVTMIIVITLGIVFEVKDVKVNENGIQIEHYDGTGYWIEKGEK